MYKKPQFLACYAVLSILMGIGLIIVCLITHTIGFSYKIPIYLFLIVSGFYLFIENALGWKLSMFYHLFNVTRSYSALFYLFVNISKVSFATENVNEYILKYGVQALISMVMIYYLLSFDVTQFFNIHSVDKNNFFKLAFPTVFIIVIAQIATHTVSL